MIKSKQVTIVTLALASISESFNLMQHDGGALSDVDGTSITESLVGLRGDLSKALADTRGKLAPLRSVLGFLQHLKKGSYNVSQSLKDSLADSESTFKELEKMLADAENDLRDIDQILVYTRKFDELNGNSTQKTGETSSNSGENELFEKILNNVFGGPVPAAAQKAQLIKGCGRPGCEGCGGRTEFELNSNDEMGGLGMFGDILGAEDLKSLLGGLAPKPAPKPAPKAEIPADLEEKLQKMFGGQKVKIINMNESPGLEELRQHLMNFKHVH